MNTKLHALVDANDRPLSFFMTAGQVSDYTGQAAVLDDLPKAQWLLGDRGYDADWFRDALGAKGIQHCIPGRRSHNEPVRYDKRRHRRRNRIEIILGRLKSGAASQPAVSAAQPRSSPPSPSLPRSSSGCYQRVLTLMIALVASFPLALRRLPLPLPIVRITLGVGIAAASDAAASSRPGRAPFYSAPLKPIDPVLAADLQIGPGRIRGALVGGLLASLQWVDVATVAATLPIVRPLTGLFGRIGHRADIHGRIQSSADVERL